MPYRGSFAVSGAVVFSFFLGCSGSDGGSDDDDDDTNRQGNVTFGETCSAPTPCGGDPTGSWRIASACVEPVGPDFDCNWQLTANGTISGTATFDSGSYSFDYDEELRHCGWVDGGVHGGGGTYTLSGTELVMFDQTYGYCVQGDRLWLWDMTAVYPDYSVYELSRAPGGQ